MANYTGYLTPPASKDTDLNSLLFYFKDGYGMNYGRFYGRYITAIIGAGAWVNENKTASGTFTRNLPINMPANNFSGEKTPTLVDIFYNRILIEPQEFDFGVVVSTEEQTFKVWNAYLDRIINLEGILETDLVGVYLIGDKPPPDVVFNQLKEREYIIQATSDGPPTIESYITFGWETPYADVQLTIVGRRLIAFPYLFRTGMTETLEWLTKVLTSHNGTEKRGRIRTAPRQQFSAAAFVQPTEHARMDNMLYGWRSNIWAVPHWGEARPVTSSVAIDDQVIYVDTAYGDFRVDGLCILWENERVFDLFEILSFTAASITLDRGITADFTENALIAPARESRMKTKPKRVSTGHNAAVNVVFDVDDNIVLPSEASAVQYNSEDTYLDVPLKPGGHVFTDSYEKDIRTIDYKTGVVEQQSAWSYTKPERMFLVVLEGLEEIWNFRTWLHRRAGKQRPFYMPTFENNMRILGTGNIGSSFQIKNDENAILAASRVNIYVQMKDGTYHMRRVADVFNVPPDEVTVAIDTAIVGDISDVAFISYMGLKRFASDRIQLRHLANYEVECKIPIVEVEP